MEIEELVKVKQRTPVQQLFDRVYEYGFYEVAKYVAKKGGTLDDSRDIFHDAVIALFEKVQQGWIIESEVGYIVGIAKHKWASLVKQRALTTRCIDLSESEDVKDATVNQLKLLELIRQTGTRCLELLTAFYFSKEKFSTIKEKFSFRSEHSASVQKYKCIEKIRETIKQKHIAYEDFFE